MHSYFNKPYSRAQLSINYVLVVVVAIVNSHLFLFEGVHPVKRNRGAREVEMKIPAL